MLLHPKTAGHIVFLFLLHCSFSSGIYTNFAFVGGIGFDVLRNIYSMMDDVRLTQIYIYLCLL